MLGGPIDKTRIVVGNLYEWSFDGLMNGELANDAADSSDTRSISFDSTGGSP